MSEAFKPGDVSLADLITMIDMVENHTDAIDLADKLWPMMQARPPAQGATTSTKAVQLVENLMQATVDYERAEGFEAKYLRQDLNEARAAIEAALSVAPAERQQLSEPMQCLRCGTVDAFGPVSKEKR